MKPKVIVTGGMGYIGSQTILELIRSGEFEPISVDNFLNSSPCTQENIKKICGVEVKNYAIDICDKEKFFTIFKENPDVKAIIHFAAFKSVPESVAEPLKYYFNNLTSLQNVLAACHLFNIPHLVFSSSCSIYGDVRTLPVSEETPMGIPFCPYAHTKQIGEQMIAFFTQTHPELHSIALRYFNPIGADMTGKNGELPHNTPNNLLPIMTQVASGKREQLQIFGNDYDTRDGSCIRDYIHVTDIADAHILALKYLMHQENTKCFDTFNLGSGNGISVLEMVKAFEEITGIKLNTKIVARRAGDVPAIYSNSQKAAEVLHWQCHLSLHDMIASAWKWEQELKFINY